MTNKELDELEDKYRKFASDNGMPYPTVKRDRYAKFMAKKEHDYNVKFSKYKKKEWLERFEDDQEWHKMDANNKALLLKVMTKPSGGTAREIGVDDLINGIAEIAEDEETLEVYMERLREQFEKRGEE